MLVVYRGSCLSPSSLYHLSGSLIAPSMMCFFVIILEIFPKRKGNMRLVLPCELLLGLKSKAQSLQRSSSGFNTGEGIGAAGFLMPWRCAGGEGLFWADTWVGVHSFALGLRGSTPVVLPENLGQTVEAGGQLDGIGPVVVAGSLGSQLMPRGEERKRSPSPLWACCYGKVAYPSSMRGSRV